MNIIVFIACYTRNFSLHTNYYVHGSIQSTLDWTICGVLRLELGFFDHLDRGARVTRVTMPTVRYLALGKFF
jgi:hypothetical protein